MFIFVKKLRELQLFRAPWFPAQISAGSARAVLPAKSWFQRHRHGGDWRWPGRYAVSADGFLIGLSAAAFLGFVAKTIRYQRRDSVYYLFHTGTLPLRGHNRAFQV